MGYDRQAWVLAEEAVEFIACAPRPLDGTALLELLPGEPVGLDCSLLDRHFGQVILVELLHYLAFLVENSGYLYRVSLLEPSSFGVNRVEVFLILLLLPPEPLLRFFLLPSFLFFTEWHET